MAVDVDRLADLIAAKTRVRILPAGVEGVLVGFRHAIGFLSVRVGTDDGEEVETAAVEVVELEPFDQAAADAHWAAVREADRVKLAERNRTRAAAMLATLDADQLRDVLRDALDKLTPPPGGAP